MRRIIYAIIKYRHKSGVMKFASPATDSNLLPARGSSESLAGIFVGFNGKKIDKNAFFMYLELSFIVV